MAQFLKLYESAIQRYTRGGFLTGDLVKFTSNYTSDDFFKKQAVNYLQKIDEFVKSGLNIRVSAVKPVYPSGYKPGNVQNEAESFLIDIVLERAPGLYYEFITVPAHVLEYVDTGINHAPIPDSLRRPNNEIIDPEEVATMGNDPTSYLTPNRQTLTSDRGDNKDTKSDITLTDKNIKIPSSPAEGDKDPAVASYTAKYMVKSR